MKCENEDCNNEVDIEHIGHLCAGYEGGLDCRNGDRFCNCCLSCRQNCIDESMAEEEDNLTDFI